MSLTDQTYINELYGVYASGNSREDRTGTGTISSFGVTSRYPLRIGFPLLTCKKIYWKGIVHELLWFLKGDTNIKYLQDNDVHIWDQWADSEGNLGPVYGAQWRDFNGVDQIQELMNNLRDYPLSRRHIVSAWNPSVLPNNEISPSENAANGLQALPPCHTLFQFYVEKLSTSEISSWIIEDKKCSEMSLKMKWKTLPKLIKELEKRGIEVPKYKLSCQLYQRSADMFLGVPFNIASYSLLTRMICHQLNMVPCEFIHTIGDAHVYKNHLDQVGQILERPTDRLPPTVSFKRKPKSIFDYTFEDIQLENYFPMDAIKADIAV